MANLPNIIYPHTDLKRTMLPRVSAVHKEYFGTGILIDVLVMQKFPVLPSLPVTYIMWGMTMGMLPTEQKNTPNCKLLDKQ